MQINPGPKSISELFSSDNRTVTVPTFQRNYAWEQQQIDTFLDDLTDAASSPGEKRHFYGPVVILEKPGSQERMLVDGQQRITTAVMALAILRDYLQIDLAGHTAVDGGVMEYDLLQNVSSFLFEMSSLGKPRFESNYHLKHIFFEWILVPPNLSKRKHFSKAGAGMVEADVRLTKEIRAAYLRLKGGIENYLNYGHIAKPYLDQPKSEIGSRQRRALELREALTTGFEIHSMVLTSEPDAFILFETLNDRGMKLSPADLLKTLIMSEVLEHHGDKQLESVLFKWDAIGDNIGDVPFSKFLRHYLLTKEDKPVQMRRIFGIFKAMIRDDEWAGSALAHVDALHDASVIYGQLLNIAPYSRLNDFSETHRVLLLRALSLNPDETLRNLLHRATEVLAFRWIACGRNAQQLESKYQEWCQQPSKLQTIEGTREIVGDMLASMPNDSDFRLALEMLDNEPLAKFLLRRLEQSLGSKSAWGNDLTLEHLAPQTPNPENSDWLTVVPVLADKDGEVSYKRQISSLGNLALLEKGWNSAISNYGWAIKRGEGEDKDGYRGLAAAAPLQLKPLVSLDSWTGEIIKKRTQYLVSESLKLFSSEWVLTGKSDSANFDPTS